MASLFGSNPAEKLKKHQRSLQKAMRELDREKQKLEQQEKKLIMDIKKSAKAGQMVLPHTLYPSSRSRTRAKSKQKIW